MLGRTRRNCDQDGKKASVSFRCRSRMRASVFCCRRLVWVGCWPLMVRPDQYSSGDCWPVAGDPKPLQPTAWDRARPFRQNAGELVKPSIDPLGLSALYFRPKRRGFTAPLIKMLSRDDDTIALNRGHIILYSKHTHTEPMIMLRHPFSRFNGTCLIGYPVTPTSWVQDGMIPADG